jgi:hypothetical protein
MQDRGRFGGCKLCTFVVQRRVERLRWLHKTVKMPKKLFKIMKTNSKTLWLQSKRNAEKPRSDDHLATLPKGC